MLTGQIGILTNGTGFVPNAIEWATYSNAYHVIVAISETECVSADGDPGTRRVTRRPISDFGNITWSRFDLTDTERAAVILHAENSVGLPYNYAIILTLLTARILHIRVPKLAADWLSRRPNVDCSQCADDIYNAAGIDLFTAANVLTTPGDFDRYYAQHGWLDTAATTTRIT